MTTTLSVRSFPLCIDPSVDVIEAQARQSDGDPVDLREDSQDSWSHLFRIPAAVVCVLPDVPNLLSNHFFGDHRAIAHCKFLVCYDPVGMLLYLMVITDQGGRIHIEELPEEYRGQAVEKPSIRLVFNGTEDRAEFVKGLSQHTLDVLAEPPRFIGVGVLSDEG